MASLSFPEANVLLIEYSEDASELRSRVYTLPLVETAETPKGDDETPSPDGGNAVQASSSLSDALADQGSTSRAHSDPDHSDYDASDSDTDEDAPLVPGNTRPMISISHLLSTENPKSFQSTEGRFATNGDQCDLLDDLGSYGFTLPDTHLRLFLEWVRSRNLQVGIRQPFAEDAHQLSSHDANPNAGQDTIVWRKLRKAALALCKVFSTSPGKQPKGSAGLKIHRADTSQNTGLSSSKADVPELTNYTDILKELVSALKALSNFIPKMLLMFEGDTEKEQAFSTSFESYVRRGQPASLKRFLDKAAEDYQTWQSKHADAAVPADWVGGLAAQWVDLAYRSGIGSADVETIKLRYPSALADNNDQSPPADTIPLTEGYHLLRIAPDLSAMVPERRARFENNLNVQAARDHSLVSAYFSQALAPAPPPKPATTDASSQDAPPAQARTFDVFAPSVHFLGAGSQTDTGALSGGLVFAPQTTDGMLRIHLLRAGQSLSPALRDKLLAEQAISKRDNRFALATVSFIAGQAYKQTKFPFSLFLKSFMTVKRAKGMAVGAAVEKLTVMLVAVAGFPFMTIASVPMAAAIGKGVKRVFMGKTFYRPDAALRHRDLMRLHRGGLNRDEKLYFVSDTAPEFDHHKYEVKEGNKLPTKKPKRTIDERAKDIIADSMLHPEEAGDILRRSYVHFEMARQRLTAPKKESDAKRATRFGEALHHLEKGWRYLGNSSLFLETAWDQHHEALADWEKIGPLASASVMQDFRRLVREGKIHPELPPSDTLMKEATWREKRNMTKTKKTAPKTSKQDDKKASKSDTSGSEDKSVYDELNELLKPSAADTTKFGFHWIANKAHITKAPFEKRKQFKRQLTLFRTQAYPAFSNRKEQGEAMAIDPLDAIELGNPETFAMWQMDGEQITPYARTANAEARDGPKDARDEPKAIRAAFGQLQDTIYARTRMYQEALAYLEDANVSAGPPTGSTALCTSLNAKPNIVTAWKNADNAAAIKGFDYAKRIHHDVRNWRHKTSLTEKLGLPTLTIGEMVTSYYNRLNYGELGAAIGMDPANEEDKGLRVAAGEEITDLIRSGIGQAGRRTGIGLTISATQYAFKTAAFEKPRYHRGGYITENSGLLTPEARERTMIAQAPEIGMPLPGDEPYEAPKDLKSGAIYVGSNLIMKVGSGRHRSMLARKIFAEMVGKEFPMKSGLLERSFDSPKYSGLKEMKLRVAPLAQYYNQMDQLEGNLRLCMNYFDVLAAVGNGIEAHLFQQIDPHLDPHVIDDATSSGSSQ